MKIIFHNDSISGQKDMTNSYFCSNLS